MSESGIVFKPYKKPEPPYTCARAGCVNEAYKWNMLPSRPVRPADTVLSLTIYLCEEHTAGYVGLERIEEQQA